MLMLKRFMSISLVLLLFLLYADSSTAAIPSDYAKWSSAALAKVKEQFPRAQPVDFLYVGCKPTSKSMMDYIYKYWLRDQGHEFGAYVTVKVNVQTQRVVRTVLETTESALPSYGKWRAAARQAVLSRYPESRIIDFRPYDCKWLSDHRANQSFLFWTEQHNQPLYVLATITYDIPSENIVSIHVAPADTPLPQP